MGLTDPKEGTVIESAAETVERSQQLIRNSNLQQAIMEEKKQIREERSKRHQEWMQEVQQLRGLKEEYLTKTRQLTELRSKTQSNLASSQDESCSFELAWGLSEDDLLAFEQELASLREQIQLQELGVSKSLARKQTANAEDIGGRSNYTKEPTYVGRALRVPPSDPIEKVF